MKILTWNIQWGLGMDGVCDLKRVTDYARATGADVICLQEVADGYDDLEGSQGENQFAVIAALMVVLVSRRPPSNDTSRRSSVAHCSNGSTVANSASSWR